MITGAMVKISGQRRGRRRTGALGSAPAEAAGDRGGKRRITLMRVRDQHRRREHGGFCLSGRDADVTQTNDYPLAHTRDMETSERTDSSRRIQ